MTAGAEVGDAGLLLSAPLSWGWALVPRDQAPSSPATSLTGPAHSESLSWREECSSSLSPRGPCSWCGGATAVRGVEQLAGEPGGVDTGCVAVGVSTEPTHSGHCNDQAIFYSLHTSESLRWPRSPRSPPGPSLLECQLGTWACSVLLARAGLTLALGWHVPSWGLPSLTALVALHHACAHSSS